MRLGPLPPDGKQQSFGPHQPPAMSRKWRLHPSGSRLQTGANDPERSNSRQNRSSVVL
jgi:hypothetical protein